MPPPGMPPAMPPGMPPGMPPMGYPGMPCGSPGHSPMSGAPRAPPPQQQQQQQQQQRQPAAAAPSSGTDGSTLQPGMVVRIAGLQKSVELNGAEGTLESFDPQAGRWIVCLRSDQSTKSLKPENLRCSAASATSAASGERLT
mmetsp:Transcript_9370/g.33202  ORF Transcript_9370/g.33202 Transcript_9370/m.33202 type:complete len:142 (+) Transcript_9370:1-426(+)